MQTVVRIKQHVVGLSSLRSQLYLKNNCQADEAQPALLATRELVSNVIQTRESGSPGLSCAKISLKEDDVPTLFPVVEAMLLPPIRRTLMTMVHLGSK